VWKSIDRYSKDYIEMETKDKVNFYRTPPSILQAQLNAYDGVASKKAAENPMFKEIMASQRAFAQRVLRWDFNNNVDRRMAYNHYFGRGAADGKAAPKGAAPAAKGAAKKG
jgi:TRAP-type mannitol/chloroaromatic compound transport system substrate-binding protein